MKQSKEIKKLVDRVIAKPGKKISLKDYDADWTGSIKDKKKARTPDTAPSIKTNCTRRTNMRS